MRSIIELSGEERDELIACLGAAYQVDRRYDVDAPQDDRYKNEAYDDAVKADDGTYRLTYVDATEGEVLRYASMIDGLSREELDIVGDEADQIYLECRRVAEHIRERVREQRKARKVATAGG